MVRDQLLYALKRRPGDSRLLEPVYQENRCTRKIFPGKIYPTLVAQGGVGGGGDIS